MRAVGDAVAAQVVGPNAHRDAIYVDVTVYNANIGSRGPRLLLAVRARDVFLMSNLKRGACLVVMEP